MVYTINARNVSEALWLGKELLEAVGVPVQTRNGPALEMPGPVATTYSAPWERVLFYPERDANPFFHFFESLWMLAGRNDVEFIKRFNSRIDNYTDDGKTFHGAYGYRWRNYFGPEQNSDQLPKIIHRLRHYENDRRAVLSMWSPWVDLTTDNSGKDFPCNTHIYFQVRNGLLDMMVCCRSNDMIWGAYGANAVHMSYLMEYVAGMVGVGVGNYTQMSFNFHAYLEPLAKLKGMSPQYDPYAELELVGGGIQVPLIQHRDSFDEELKTWMSGMYGEEFQNTFFNDVASPMMTVWELYKADLPQAALDECHMIQDDAWSKACYEWVDRRIK